MLARGRARWGGGGYRGRCVVGWAGMGGCGQHGGRGEAAAMGDVYKLGRMDEQRKKKRGKKKYREGNRWAPPMVLLTVSKWHPFHPS